MDNGSNTVGAEGKRLRLPKVAQVKMAEAVRYGAAYSWIGAACGWIDGPILTCQVVEACGRWFACLAWVVPERQEPASGPVIGVDVRVA